jgi:hypothetical protein
MADPKIIDLLNQKKEGDKPFASLEYFPPRSEEGVKVGSPDWFNPFISPNVGCEPRSNSWTSLNIGLHGTNAHIHHMHTILKLSPFFRMCSIIFCYKPMH